MKTYVLTMSKVFPSYHPKKGQPTNFRSKHMDEIKLHTIRGNYALWKKRIDEINEGIAMLSVREWSAKPYCSPQVELFCLFKGEVAIQKINLNIHDDAGSAMIEAYIENKLINDEIGILLIKNDGLEIQDFIDWFTKPLIGGGIIHFTDLRY